MQRKFKYQKEKKRPEKKERRVHRRLLQKKAVLRIKQPEQVEKQVIPPIQILTLTHPNGVKQSSSEEEDIGMHKCRRKIMLRLKMRN